MYMFPKNPGRYQLIKDALNRQRIHKSFVSHHFYSFRSCLVLANFSIESIFLVTVGVRACVAVLYTNFARSA